MRFVQLSATTSGVSDVKETIKVAKNEKKLLKRETLLFIDEIHRFNKLQQVKPARYIFVLCIAQFHVCVILYVCDKKICHFDNNNFD